MQVMEIEDQLGLQVSRRQRLVIERGEGVRVWDDMGKSYLDFTSGWGVTCLGHAHPIIVQALTEQAGRIIQNPNSGFTYSPARAQALETLKSVLPSALRRIYFANSGAEANDAALKLARKVTGRERVLALSGSFHGRTLATLSVSSGLQNSARFLPKVPGNQFLPLDDPHSLKDAMGDDVAAVILEPVQGEGGARVLDGDFLRQVQDLCRYHSCLLIVDEVQTGFGRTGKFFALEHYDLSPDIMTMGKGIAGGLAFAALAMTSRVADAVQQGDHGGTYCGNPLACAVSAAVIAYLRDSSVIDNVVRLGEVALQDLEELQQQFPDLICNARGQGLLLAIDLAADELVWPLADLCQQQGLLVTPTRNAVLRLLPPLVLDREEWCEGLRCLRQALLVLRENWDGNRREGRSETQGGGQGESRDAGEPALDSIT